MNFVDDQGKWSVLSMLHDCCFEKMEKILKDKKNEKMKIHIQCMLKQNSGGK